jgi:hypothetical protein
LDVERVTFPLQDIEPIAASRLGLQPRQLAEHHCYRSHTTICTNVNRLASWLTFGVEFSRAKRLRAVVLGKLPLKALTGRVPHLLLMPF